MTSRTVSDEVRLPGHRRLTAGDEFSVSGQGRFKFISLTETERDCWITCWGGKDGYGAFRSFACERVRTVHRDRKLRQ